ncbi:MAG: 3'-5' exonuclease [Myxococcaceae bacterium]|nr:3'-5' exonuclease [Myxococcaceae bacterium]
MFDVAHLLDRHVFVDIETTGLDANTDEVIELGAVFVRDGSIEREASWLVRPTRPVPAVITALTGLSTDALAGTPSFEELSHELVGAFDGYTVVAHNAVFEQSFLKELLAGVPVLDSCELALILFPELRSHALEALVRWAGLGDGARHRALADAHDTFRVVSVLLERAAAEAPGWSLTQLTGRLPTGPLQRLLLGLARTTGASAARPHEKPAADVELPAVLERWSHAPESLAIELEVADAAALAVACARKVNGSTWVVAPHAHLRRLEAVPRLPPRDGAPTGARLKALLSRRVVLDPTLAASMAYLERWGARAGVDVSTLSGFWRDRVPLFDVMRTLLRAPADAPPPPGLYVGTPADVASWLEAGVAPQALVWLDAPTAPELERRRLTVTVEVSSLLRLPELFELAAPGRPMTPGLKAVHARTRALALRLAPFTEATRLDRSTPEPWLGLRDELLAVGKDLAWWLSELRGAPPSPLLDGVIDEAARLAERLQQLVHPAVRDEVWASASAVWRRPDVAAAQASIAALTAKAPCLFVSDVRRGEAWPSRLGSPPLVQHGAVSAARPLLVAARLESEAGLAETALHVDGPLTVLSAEPLTEPLVAAFVASAARQSRQVRLHAAGAWPGDVVLQEWWGHGPVPPSRGPVVVIGGGDRFAVRRLLAAGRPVEALLLRTPFDPAAWAAPLAGVSWFESSPYALASRAVEAPARIR